MFWVGVTITTIAFVAFAFKTYVVWDASRDLYNGGGVPTLDYVIFFPPLLSFSVVTLLASLEIRPFPYFGIALWLLLVLISGFLHWLFVRLGAPHRDAQLEEIKRKASDSANDGESVGAVASGRAEGR